MNKLSKPSLIYNKHFSDGFKSGLLHDDKDPLCVNNIRKANLPHNSLKVNLYWDGYLAGVNKAKEKLVK